MTGFMGHDQTYVIAEVGSNHGGSLDAALALIDAAADAGADAAKFQLWHTDHMYDPTQFPVEHAEAVRWQMPEAWLPLLAKRCEERGIDFGCSAFCFDALDAVDPFVKWHKVASIEATWWEFVYAVAQKGKPVIASVGMGSQGFDLPTDLVTLHCVTAYPASLEDLHLHSRYEGRWPWGLSDHTTHPTIAPCAAVALGASVIEKHMKLHNEFYFGGQGGLMDFRRPRLQWDERPPDFDHSIDQFHFRLMVDAIRLTEQALGSSEKRVRPSEEKYLKYRRGPRGLRGA